MIESRGDIEPVFNIDRHSVRTAFRSPVEQLFAARKFNAAVFEQIESPQLSVISDFVVVVVGHEQIPVVGRNGDAIRPVDLVRDSAEVDASALSSATSQLRSVASPRTSAFQDSIASPSG